MNKICTECGAAFEARGRALRCWRCRGAAGPEPPTAAQRARDEALTRAGVRVTRDEQGRRLLILPQDAAATPPQKKRPKKPKEYLGQSLDAVLWRLDQENEARRSRGLAALSYGQFVALERARNTNETKRNET